MNIKTEINKLSHRDKKEFLTLVEDYSNDGKRLEPTYNMVKKTNPIKNTNSLNIFEYAELKCPECGRKGELRINWYTKNKPKNFQEPISN